MKFVCCTEGERRKEGSVRAMQKHMSKDGKTVFRGSFRMDRNRMKACIFSQRKHRHFIIINLLSDTIKFFLEAIYQHTDFRKLK